MEIQYEINSILPCEIKNSFSTIESFVPYTPMQLLRTNYFSGELSQFSSIILKNSIKVNRQIDDERIYAEMSSVLLDMVFVMNKSFLHNIELNLKTRGKSCFCSKSLTNIEKYIAIYTYLLEIEFHKIKRDLSALYFFQECEDNECRDKFRQIIEKKYSLNINASTSQQNTFYYLSTNIISKYFKIDIWDIKRFLELLQAYKPNEIDFLQRSNCFCLVHEGQNYFFSISGYLPDLEKKYDKVAKQLEKNLQAYPTYRNIQYCPLSDDTLSFGYIDNTYNFRLFDKPIKYKDCHITKETSRLFSCCERKIIPFLTHLSDNIVFYCKYSPCCLCLPAIEDEKNIYKYLRFLYFAKDSKQFYKKLNKNKNMILKSFSFENK